MNELMNGKKGYELKAKVKVAEPISLADDGGGIEKPYELTQDYLRNMIAQEGKDSIHW